MLLDASQLLRHDQVMDDIDKKYGIGQDADYHAVLNAAMHDLASVYKLK